MRKCIAYVGMAVLLCGLAGCGASADSLLKDQIKNMNELADAMEKKDDARAKELQTKMQETDKKLQALKLSDEDKKKLIERHQDEIKQATTRLVQASASRMGDFGKGLGGGLPGMPQMPGFGGNQPGLPVPAMPGAAGERKNP